MVQVGTTPGGDADEAAGDALLRDPKCDCAGVEVDDHEQVGRAVYLMDTLGECDLGRAADGRGAPVRGEHMVWWKAERRR